MKTPDVWGLTPQGFYRPAYVEILNAMEYKARELFGEGVNLTVRSPLGMFLRIYAWMMNILFSILEDVYNSRYADTAVGNSLYNLGRNIGLKLLAANKAVGHITIRAKPGTIIPAGYLVGTPGGLQYVTVDKTIVGDDSVSITIIQAVETGEMYNTPAGTVSMIVNPMSVKGVESVINESDITGGRGKETDDEYRKRYYESVDYAGGVNADAIRAAILQDVDGVHAAKVYENDSDDYDPVFDLTPHSIGVVVYGGQAGDIAEVIYHRKAGGIQTVGNVTVPVLSESGQLININFSRPDLVKIYVRVYNLRTDISFPGREAIVHALMEAIGSDTDNIGGLNVGSDVVYMTIPGKIMAVQGVIDFDVQIGTSLEAFGWKNISIGIRQKAIVNDGTVVIG